MWQTPHTRQTQRRARRRSLLGPLACLLTVLFVGVLIGRLTSGTPDPAAQIYLKNTQPSPTVAAASPPPEPQAFAEPIPRETPKSPRVRRSSTPKPTPSTGGQVPGDMNDPTKVFGSNDLDVSTSLATQVVQLTNSVRRSHGCRPLRTDRRLTRSAEVHSLEMARSGQFSFDSPDGSSPWDRMARAGYTQGAAENIGRGYVTAEEAVQGWMANRDHRKNILNCEIRAIGVGVVADAGGPWWTQDFGYS
ncbi:hypothetical protein GCM10022248_78430 [Nonomuraea soli]